MGRLQDKVCIVTGAGSRSDGIGTGRATAVVFAREGGRVLVVDRDEDAALVTKKLIDAEGGEAEVCVADLTIAADTEAMVARAVGLWGRLDVLDNNIGVQFFGSIANTSEEEWDSAVSLNLKAMMLASKYAIPAMIASGGGSIVNISSISGIRPRGGNALYSTFKGAVIPLTLAMAVDHGPDGIRVNCVIPGPISTPMAEAEGALSEERLAARRSSSPLLAIGTGWDVAYAAAFLASDEARYITGVSLPVNGGVSIRTPSR